MIRSLAETLAAVAVALFWLTGTPAAQVAVAEKDGRFVAIDVYVDPQGASLGAYQLVVTAPSASAQIVGIEGGGHPAFSEPPFYDPAALNAQRIILAAFSTALHFRGGRGELPQTPTRVASLHFRVTGDQDPDLTIRLQVAYDANGTEISAHAHLEGVGK